MLSNFSIPDKTLNKSFKLVCFFFSPPYFLYFGVQSMAEFTVVDLDLPWEVELGQGDWPSLRCWAEYAVPKHGLGLSLRSPSLSPQGPALNASNAE